MAITYITSKQLANELKISLDRLTEIEDFFEAIPDDEWELKPNKDYRVVNSSGLREYTQDGAYTIARYLEATQKLSLLNKIKDWFTGYRKKIRQSFVRQKITDNCSSLIRRSDSFWVSRKDAVSIFGTRPDYLQKMVDCARTSEKPLIRGEDYDKFFDETYYSLSGIYKLSLAFSKSLTKKNRRDECKDVGEVAETHIRSLVEQIKQRELRISKVCKDVKEKRDKKTCWVTGKKPNRNNTFNLAAHHLYSRCEYPHLADSPDNLITITEEIHKQFHEHFMGGNNKPCTPKDFIDFVRQYYPDGFTTINRLEEHRRKLGNQEPIDTRKPHVLYLPANRVS